MASDMGSLNITIESLSVPDYWSTDSGKIRVRLKAEDSKGLDDLVGSPGNIHNSFVY